MSSTLVLRRFAFGALIAVGAWGAGCTDGQGGSPCETIGEEMCEGTALLRCNGETWLELAACDKTCVETPPTSHSTLAGSETWSCAEGPHIVEATLTVPEGETLTIEAGTEVRIVRGARIDTAAAGRIVAESVVGAEILFTSDDNTKGGYGGLNQGGVNVFAVADADAASRFEHVIFERALHGLGVLGLSATNVAPQVLSSTFRDNENWGILVRGCSGTPEVPDFESETNRFYENGQGAVSPCL